jgi:hypothetical protein
MCSDKKFLKLGMYKRVILTHNRYSLRYPDTGENYTGDFQITFKRDSKVYNNVFSAIKKVGHRRICPLRLLYWLK